MWEVGGNRRLASRWDGGGAVFGSLGIGDKLACRSGAAAGYAVEGREGQLLITCFGPVSMVMGFRHEAGRGGAGR